MAAPGSGENGRGELGEGGREVRLRETWPRWRRVLSILLRVGLVAAAAGAALWQYLRLREPATVDAFIVHAGPVDRILVATGRVRPERTVTVYAKQAGQIVRLEKEEGDPVASGEALVVMDATASRAVLEQVRAAIAAKDKELEQARREYQRQRALREVNAASPEILEQAQLAVDRAEQELRRLKASEEESETRLADYTLLSPLDGTVLRRYVDGGQIVDPQSKIYELATTGTTEVELEVDEAFGAEVRPGMEAVLAPAGADRRRPGRVSFVAPRVDPSSGGRIVRVRMDGEGAETLPPGLSVDVNLIVERLASELTVPRSAILDSAGAPRVRVVEEGRVAERPIRFLDWPAREVVVSEGLREGDAVLARPTSAAVGQAVRTRFAP